MRARTHTRAPLFLSGRAYHTTNLRQFSASKMVEDNAYIRVQASLAGINTLRTRPGLAMDATIVSGPAGVWWGWGGPRSTQAWCHCRASEPVLARC